MDDKRSLIEPVYTIGVAAGKLNVSVHSLRQYEREGLILPFKTPSGRRLYSELELKKVRCIKRMIQEDGLNFEGIRRLMALVPCWELRNCSLKQQEACRAYHRAERPCWDTEEKCSHPLASCRDCPVYQETADCSDLKRLIYHHNRGG